MGWLGSGVSDPYPSRIPILASYAYLRKYNDAHCGRLINDPRYEMLLDSGAFTAFNSGSEIGLSEYLAFLHKWGSRLFGYMALDKLQDPATTDANLRVMIGDGLAPVPIHVFGDDGPRMDHLFTQSDWVACGGLRRPHRGAAPATYVKQKMEWANGRNVHWLGYTELGMIKGFRPYSCDCASWTSGRTFGRLFMYAGNCSMIEVTKEVWDARQGVRKLPGGHAAIRKLLFMHGVDPDVFNRPESWRYEAGGEHKVHNMNARAWVWYTLEVRRLFGTRLFLATIADNRDIEALSMAADWAIARGLLPGYSP